jgi:hypothetical protein
VDINRYAYSGNDPINGMDASGHMNQSMFNSISSYSNNAITNNGGATYGTISSANTASSSSGTSSSWGGNDSNSDKTHSDSETEARSGDNNDGGTIGGGNGRDGITADDIIDKTAIIAGPLVVVDGPLPYGGTAAAGVVIVGAAIAGAVIVVNGITDHLNSESDSGESEPTANPAGEPQGGLGEPTENDGYVPPKNWNVSKST